VAQVHFEHILLQIVKETSGYIQNVPSGHLAGHIFKAITMCPLVTLRSKWWAHCESNLDEWLRFHAGHIVSHILKETHGFFHKVPTGYLAEYIVKELSMYLLVTCWLNCLRNHNVITTETLGKWGSAPSGSGSEHAQESHHRRLNIGPIVSAYSYSCKYFCYIY